jgi:hypothetical protein
MQCEITEHAIKLLKLEGGRPSLVMDIGNQSKLRVQVCLMCCGFFLEFLDSDRIGS